jgi:hypothetical protein
VRVTVGISRTIVRPGDDPLSATLQRIEYDTDHLDIELPSGEVVSRVYLLADGMQLLSLPLDPGGFMYAAPGLLGGPPRHDAAPGRAPDRAWWPGSVWPDAALTLGMFLVAFGCGWLALNWTPLMWAATWITSALTAAGGWRLAQDIARRRRRIR